MVRDFLFLNCEDGKHDWQSVGGCNAGCGKDCACSVPVHECATCGDCDYGENEDAVEVRDWCLRTRPPSDDEIQMFDRALIASSELLYELKT